MAAGAPLPPLARVLAIIGGVALLLAVAVGGALLWLDSAGGRHFAAERIAALEPENGLRISVGRIDGALSGRFTLRDVRIADPRGVFATLPRVDVAWRPSALLRSHIVIDELIAPTGRILRRPELLPVPDTGEPILPDIDLDIARLRLDAATLEPAVAGRAAVASLTGRAAIADRTAIAAVTLTTTAGDRLVLDLDAAPDNDRLDVDARLAAPAGGVLSGLAGFTEPLVARIDGRGSWSRWRGGADATLGGRRIVSLALSADAGRFALRGTADPGALLGPGALARLTAGGLRLDATATAEARVVDLRVTAAAPALALSAAGRVDLGESRYENLVASIRLLRPAALFDAATGRDVRLDVTADGPMAAARLSYRASAASIGFGTTAFLAATARGEATIGDMPWSVPLSLRAARVTGLDPAVGGLLTNLRADGTLRVTADQILSDDIRIASDRLSGTAILAYTIRTGDYDVALNGRLARYAVAGLGTLDLSTDARLVPDGRGGFRLRGTVTARAVQLESAGLRETLGGLPVVTAAIERTPGGDILIRNGRLTAPRLRVTDAAGVYTAGGQLRLTARGTSADYGPFSVALAGPATRPRVTLRAARPDLGLGLTAVEALLTPTRSGYDARIRGQSPYGPLTADAAIAFGAGPLAVDLRSLTLAGITARGRLVQTAAGPFAGTLAVNGSGLSGSIRLVAQGAMQRADIGLTAANARLPLTPPVTIREGRIEAVALLTPGAPTLTGSARLAGVRRDTLLVDTLAAAVDYRAGTGTASIDATGRSGVPFRLASRIGFAPDRIRVDAGGEANRIPLRLARTAEFVPIAGGWRLLPATLQLPDGRIDIAGSFGAATALDARLVGVDLSIARAVAPALLIGGEANGRITLALPAAPGAIPTARADLRLARLTRAAVGSVSLPVDVALLGTLGSGGGDFSAVVRRQGAVIGRLQARLAPLPGSAAQPWTERLLAAPLTGGIRYTGPSEVLWALSGITGQEVRGPVAIGADLAGRLSDPRVSGVARATDLRYENAAFGTVLDDIRLDSRFTGERFELTSLTATAGRGGSITASGAVDLAAERGFPLQIRAQLTRALVANSANIQATVTGPLTIVNDVQGARITGEIAVDRARYRIVRTDAAEVASLRVRRRGDPLFPPEEPAGPPSVWALDLRVRAPNELFVEGMGLESEWRANLRVGGNLTAPRITGPVDLNRGTYSFAGRRFDLSRGAIRFTGNSPPDPQLDIVASTTVEGVTANVAVTGTGLNPQIAFTSTPDLPQDEVLSRLLFGGSVTELSPLEAVQLGAALNSLRGSGGGLNPLGKLRGATGLDRLRVLGADETSGRGTSIAAGKYIGRNVYVELTTDSEGNTLTQLEINLTRALKLLAQVGAFGTNSVGVRYAKEY
ncbi:MAG: translocation/assembly module TamB domain-containing protein [Alphaproteobacteria bacterium]|nr:translocation/assembly module TamB domain-containing protein [Alphaproteobacteria bacterium]